MGVEEDKKAQSESVKESRAEKTTNQTKQNIAATLNDGDIEELKKTYGLTQDSFIEGVRKSEKYGEKAKKLGNNDVITLAAEDKTLKEYYNKYIKKKREVIPQSTTPSTPMSNEEQKNLNPEEFLPENTDGEEFSQKEFEKIKKEKGQDAAKAYAAKWSTEKIIKKPAEKKEEPKKEEKAPEKKPEERKPEEKKEEPKKEEKAPDKKPEEKKETKSFRKKLNPKNRFKKKDKKPESKDKKSGTLAKVGSAITYLPKQAWKGTKAVGNATRKGVKAIPHQTWNLVSYAPRVARHTLGKYPFFDWINHGFNKPGLKKNRDNYASKWKWEQAAKKK